MLQENKHLFEKEIESDQPRLQINAEWHWHSKIWVDFPFKDTVL